MDFWFLLKERYVFVSIIVILFLVSLFLLLAVWKNRSRLAKVLLTMVTIVSILTVVFSLYAFIFVISFGYNS